MLWALITPIFPVLILGLAFGAALRTFRKPRPMWENIVGALLAGWLALIAVLIGILMYGPLLEA